MRITQLTVGAKKSKNYQSYDCIFQLAFDETENYTPETIHALVKELQARCRQHIDDQFTLDAQQ
jgi:hypothetical protein